MKARSGEKGFTLLEILVALGVGTVILTGVVGAIYQTARMTMQSNPEILATQDIKAVAATMRTDMMLSDNQTTPLDGASSDDSAVLNWNTWSVDNVTGMMTPVPHSITYSLSGGRVQRNYDGASSFVGKYISDIHFSRSGNIMKVTVTSSPVAISVGSVTNWVVGTTDKAKQQTYQFYLQPKAELVQ